MIAALDALAVALGGRDREGQLDLSPSDVASDREADGLEDAEHLPVVRKHLRDEALDAQRAGERRELLEQSRADAPALVVVGDGERDLRRLRVAQPREVRDGDDPVVDRSRRAHPPRAQSALVSGSTRRCVDAPGTRGTAGTGSPCERPREELEQRVRVVRRPGAAGAASCRHEG